MNKILSSSRQISSRIQQTKQQQLTYKQQGCVFNDQDVYKLHSNTMTEKMLKVFDAKKQVQVPSRPDVHLLVKSMSQPIQVFEDTRSGSKSILDKTVEFVKKKQRALNVKVFKNYLKSNNKRSSSMYDT